MASLPRRPLLHDDDRNDLPTLSRWDESPAPRLPGSTSDVTVVDGTPTWAIGPTYEPSWECTCPFDCLHDHEHE